MTPLEKEQTCQEMAQTYHSKFSDIATLTSPELLKTRSSQQSHDGYESSNSRMILVDVRTKEEREVSMIPNSITLDEFHKLDPELKNGTVSTIVTYCTIGYRSGLEAQKLRELYRIPSDKIRNLDGIVPYTHACLHSHDGGNALLINPKTNESTNHVHVFGPSWDLVPEEFTSISFSTSGTILKTIGVGMSILGNSTKRMFCFFKKFFE